MPNYLTKEEIRQWRSSLERITLEDYAKKLGKVIQEEKETNDMVDITLKQNHSTRYISEDEAISAPKQTVRAERISSLAQQSFEREKEISYADLKQTTTTNKTEPKKVSAKTEIKETKKATKKESVKEKKVEQPKANLQATIIEEDVQLTFKKNLTPREQAVFEHFLNNKNSIVYAKDLAQVLDLPRDYVYKYIKNLRAKLNEDALHNANNGGFILEVK